jgi:hypothetical protein
MADESGDHRSAKAEAKAAQARAKAMRPWYKKKRFILGGLLAIIVIAAVASSTSSKKIIDAADNTKTSTAGIGDPVRDGKFEFTVSKVDCGRSRVGTKDFGKSAQGQYCFVSVTVENIGKESQSLFGSNQHLFDNQGRKFDADGEAAIYVEDSKTLYESINPGNKVNGILIFDIPASATPVKIELHDSAFSRGVTVALT